MTDRPEISQIAEAIRSRRRFVISSHARPDGDAIGSQMAAAYALRALGKDVVVVNADPAPAPLMQFPGVASIGIAKRVEGDFDAAIIMECGDLSRTGVEGLDRFFLINIDHHPGNAGYGQINWFNPSAAACGEMVFDLVAALGVPLSIEIATHVYLAILTDTGSFHYANITPRTFEISRETLMAGVDPVAVARSVYDSNNMGRLKLFGAVLSAMQLDTNGRIAIVYLDHEMARAAGGTYDDTEGLINLPLTVKEIEAVVFFKQI
jgi:phosphoesterase RecJ-like protein